MSGLESDAFTGTLDRKVPAFVQNIAMKQALQTGFETKKMHNVFGIRRQTFQESSSVLNSDRGPMLGSERILKQQTDKASNQKSNMDLAAAIEEIARQHKESLPDIERMSTLPAMFKKKESLRLVAGQSKINR